MWGEINAGYWYCIWYDLYLLENVTFVKAILLFLIQENKTVTIVNIAFGLMAI
jgi:hypothetical protein